MKCGNELAKCTILQSTSCDYFKSEIVTSFSTMSVYKYKYIYKHTYTFGIAARVDGRRSQRPANLPNTRTICMSTVCSGNLRQLSLLAITAFTHLAFLVNYVNKDRIDIIR